MHHDGLKTILNSLPSALSRRGLAPLLMGGLLATGVENVGAKRKRKQRKRKNKQRKNDRPKTRVDAECPAPEVFKVGKTSPDIRLAQTFTAERSGQLIRADLLLLGDGKVEPEFTARLVPVDEAGVPTENVLAEASVSGAGVSASSTVSFVFADPPPVVAGTVYALVLARPGSEFFSWLVRGDNSCNGRAFFSLGQNAPFQQFPDAESDFIFTTFVRS
jgi:hypothetical protein